MKFAYEAVTQKPNPWFGQPEFCLPRPPHPLETFNSQWREAKFAALKTALYHGQGGTDISLAMTEITDQVVIGILDKHTRHLQGRVPFAVVALGGYGAGQIAPKSDLELRIVSTKSPEAFVRLLNFKPRRMGCEIAEEEITGWTAMYNDLMAFGFKLDQGIHPINFPITVSPGCEGADHAQDSRSAKKDEDGWIEVMSSLLTARLLIGDPQVFMQYQLHIEKMILDHHQELLRSFRTLRSTLRDKYGDYDVSPHDLKHSAGGLRDSNYIDWEHRIGQILGKRILTDSELAEFKVVQSRQLAAKQALHLAYPARTRVYEKVLYSVNQSNILALPFRSGDIDFENEPERAFDHAERVYYKTAQHVAHLTDKVQRRGDRVFGLAGDPTSTDEIYAISSHLRALRKADAPHEQVAEVVLGVYERWLEAGKRSAEDAAGWEGFLDSLDYLSRDLEHAAFRGEVVSRQFRNLLQDPGHIAIALERLGKGGFLDHLTPSFANTRDVPLPVARQGQTIEGRTFDALRKLDQILTDEALQTHLDIRAFIKELTRVDIQELSISLLLRDTGMTRERVKAHAESGALLARRDAKSLGFNDGECERIGNLVLHHSIFSHSTQQQRVNGKVLDRICSGLVSEKELFKAFVIDWADNAASPPFSHAKESRLVQLFMLARQRLHHGSQFQQAFLAESQEKILGHLAGFGFVGSASLGQAELARHISAMPEEYALNTPPVVIAAHVAFAKQLEERLKSGTPLHEIQPFLYCIPSRDAFTKNLVFVAPDADGLFARITGALTKNGQNIEDAQIATRGDLPIACDNFTVTFGSELLDDDLRRMQKYVVEAFANAEISLEIWNNRRVLKAEAAHPPRARHRDKVVDVHNDSESGATSVTVRTVGDFQGLACVLGHAFSRELGLSIVHATLNAGGERVKNHFLVVDKNGHAVAEGQFKNLEQTIFHAVFENGAAPA